MHVISINSTPNTNSILFVCNPRKKPNYLPTQHILLDRVLVYSIRIILETYSYPIMRAVPSLEYRTFPFP